MECSQTIDDMKSKWVSSFSAVALVLACLAPTHAEAQQYKETYPRLGAYEIGSGLVITDPNFRERLARHDIVILGMWRGWSKKDDVSGEQLSIRGRRRRH